MMASAEQPPCPLCWPEVCEAWRLDDAVMGQAFESVQPALRACIKTGIAFQYALHGEQPNQQSRYICDSTRGFSHCLSYQPAEWTVLFLRPEYASGPRLIAALMPALLARVPLVGVVCLGALPSPVVCTSLELLGIEDVFCLADTATAQQLLQQLMATTARGRALFLHKGELAPLEQAARRQGLATWQEDTAPCIVLNTKSGCDVQALQWCHPDAQFRSEEAGHACGVDAVLCVAQSLLPAALPRQNAPLLLGAGMEGIWWHKHLTPDFFMEKQLQAVCTVDHLNGEAAI